MARSPKLQVKKESLGALSADDLRDVVGQTTDICLHLPNTIVVKTDPLHTRQAGCERPSCCSCTAVSDTVER